MLFNISFQSNAKRLASVIKEVGGSMLDDVRIGVSLDLEKEYLQNKRRYINAINLQLQEMVTQEGMGFCFYRVSQSNTFTCGGKVFIGFKVTKEKYYQL